MVPIVRTARVSNSAVVLFPECYDCRVKCHTARGLEMILHNTQNSHSAFGFCVCAHRTGNRCLWDGRVVCNVFRRVREIAKAIVSIVMSVRPFGSTRLPLNDFLFTYFSKISQEKLRVKQSHYRPGQSLRVPGSWGSQIFKTIGTWRW
jgi:hypothetical protein